MRWSQLDNTLELAEKEKKKGELEGIPCRRVLRRSSGCRVRVETMPAVKPAIVSMKDVDEAFCSRID